MALIIEGGDIHLCDLRTRMPFKYGIATMTHAPHAFVRLRLVVDGKAVTGIAADTLPPKWFTKDPHKPLDEELREMLRVIEKALACATAYRWPESVFEAWLAVFAGQDGWADCEGLPKLLVHFGTSLVERALIDGFCRGRGQTFARALHDNLFGVQLDMIRPQLAGRAPSELLPSEPLNTIIARHTIGLADPLTDGDIAAEEHLHDGLPQSLEGCIRTYGLRHFKVKICGQLDRDRERLQGIESILHNLAPHDFAFTLDGNEQFHDLAVFRAYWNELQQVHVLRPFFKHLLFVEQPLHRAVALQPETADFTRWPDRPPIIIDESDGDLNSLPQALQLGYAGTSHKNCKGVFKGIANACLLRLVQQSDRHGVYCLSGEDLVNIGPVVLLQDLAVDAALGVSSVERNGHHYFTGLSMFPQEVQQQTLTAHGDLYRKGPGGWPTLAIHDGTIDIRSVAAAPFGFAPVLDVEQFSSIAQWRRNHPEKP